MANEKFKVKFGLAVGDTAATIDATTGEVIAALNNDGQVTIGKGATTNGRIDIGNRSRAIAGTPFIDFNSSVNAIDFDVRLIASGGSGTDGQGTLTAYAASIVTAGNLTINNNLQVDGNTTLGSNSSDTVAVNGLVSGVISFTDNSTTTNRGITGTVGANDYWKYGGGATGVDGGYAEIATGDNGTEPIYVRQYDALTPSTRTLTLMDASGQTTLSGDLTVLGTGYIYSSSNLAFDGVLITGSSEDVANTGAMLLTKAASYFSTGATGETSTLAAGTEGQFKSMMMTADGGGDMVVTVSNAGWKTSGTGTITFDAIGESCLLQYINSKWYAVGQNGVTFA